MESFEILRIYGTEYKAITKRILEAAMLKERIPSGVRIGIKPNLMSCIPAELGATTHPEVVAGIIEYLQENGFEDICIMEGSWVGDKTEEAFEYCGYNYVSEKYGVMLLDMQKERPCEIVYDGYKVNVCECVKDIGFLINVPVLKGHCQTNITCALKNMKGLIPNSEKRRFHSLGLFEPIAVLNACIKQDFIVVDHICGDLDSEGGGHPFYSNCVMAGSDPVLIDSFCCKLMGYELEDVPYIELAEKRGVGSCDLSKIRVSTIDGDGIEKDEILPHTHSIIKLKDKASDVDTCSACYESLMEAFGMLEEEGLLDSFNGKIGIGQGYRGKTGPYGVGNCTSNFDHFIKGCPPKAEDIYQNIRKWILSKENDSLT